MATSSSLPRFRGSQRIEKRIPSLGPETAVTSCSVRRKPTMPEQDQSTIMILSPTSTTVPSALAATPRERRKCTRPARIAVASGAPRGARRPASARSWITPTEEARRILAASLFSRPPMAV